MWEGQIDYGSYNGKDGKNLGYCITLMMVSPIDPGKIYISLFSKGIQILLKQSGGELYMSQHSGLGNKSSLEYNCHPYCFFGKLHTIEKQDCLGLLETPSQILLALNFRGIYQVRCKGVGISIANHNFLNNGNVCSYTPFPHPFEFWRKWVVRGICLTYVLLVSHYFSQKL